MAATTRRSVTTIEIAQRTAVDDTVIELLVRAFYARVRDDALLAPIFAARIGDWEPHLERMCAFWSTVALMSGRYHGQPTKMHLSLPVDAQHFDRWLDLFEQTAREVCSVSAADYLIERAQRIAESLELAIASHNGVMLAKGRRFSSEALTLNGTTGAST